MKVLLLQHVKKLGRVGEIVEVSDGYATNALFPRGLAKQATPEVLNAKKMQEASEKRQEEKEKTSMLARLTALEGKTIHIQEKVNERGSLYHALSVKEIIRAIHTEYGISIPNYCFKEKYSLKEQGNHKIILEAYGKEIACTVAISAI